LCSFAAEPNLAIASLVLDGTFHQVSEGYLLPGNPSVRKDSIGRNIIIAPMRKAEPAIRVELQETHYSVRIRGTVREEDY
jgi:hypothetical protein